MNYNLMEKFQLPVHKPTEMQAPNSSPLYRVIISMVVSIQHSGVAGTNKVTLFTGAASFYSLFLQPDGKILCSGQVGRSNHLLMRFDSTGVLDTTFGTGGYIQHATPAGMSLLNGFSSVARSDTNCFRDIRIFRSGSRTWLLRYGWSRRQHVRSKRLLQRCQFCYQWRRHGYTAAYYPK